MAEPMVQLVQTGQALSGLAFDDQGTLHVCSPTTGEILKLGGPTTSPQLETVAECPGQPTGLVHVDGKFYVSDMDAKSIVVVDPARGGSSSIATGRGDKAFRGPNGIAFGGRNESRLFFTDSGGMGETSFEEPMGAVYSCLADGRSVRALLGKGLVHPSGICTTSDGCIYVCEQMQNRVLRFVERPVGVYHCSVFCQFAGAMGPSCITSDRSGNLYVGRMDLSGLGEDVSGIVNVLQPTGAISAEIVINGPEISGLAIDKAEKFLYIAESSLGSIYRYPVELVNAGDGEGEEA